MSFPISFWCDFLGLHKLWPESDSGQQFRVLCHQLARPERNQLWRFSCFERWKRLKIFSPILKVGGFLSRSTATDFGICHHGKRSPCFSISHVTLLKAGCDQINMRCFAWFCFWFVFLPDIKVTCPENGKLHQCIIVNLLKLANQIKQMRCIIAVQCFCSQFSSPVRHGRHGPLEQSSQVLSRSFTSQLPTAFRRSFVLCSRRCGELLRWCIGC